jgi:hypothetical protein
MSDFVSIADQCLEVSDGCSSAWDDAPERFKPILKAASDLLNDIGHELRNSTTTQELASLRTLCRTAAMFFKRTNQYVDFQGRLLLAADGLLDNETAEQARSEGHE